MAKTARSGEGRGKKVTTSNRAGAAVKSRGGDQAVVRDERGQEQPTDKSRAQGTSPLGGGSGKRATPQRSGTRSGR
jgi:hypothetical protein